MAINDAEGMALTREAGEIFVRAVNCPFVDGVVFANFIATSKDGGGALVFVVGKINEDGTFNPAAHNENEVRYVAELKTLDRGTVLSAAHMLGHLASKKRPSLPQPNGAKLVGTVTGDTLAVAPSAARSIERCGLVDHDVWLMNPVRAIPCQYHLLGLKHVGTKTLDAVYRWFKAKHGLTMAIRCTKELPCHIKRWKTARKKAE